MSDVKDRLKKLYALSIRGVDGERETAKKILDTLLKKYSLDIRDLDEEEIKFFDMEFHGKEQKTILMQIIYMITNAPDTSFNLTNRTTGRTIKTQMRVYCTEAQKVDIEFLFCFYVQLWNKEKDIFLRSFIQKHRLFGESDGSERSTSLSDEELAKMFSFMSGLSDDTPLKQLKDHN